MAPMKLLHRRIGFGGSFFNSFDGNVDLLDDLDDHYTARTHKKERNWLIEKLQGVCAEFSVRITILSGDVHLAAFGRFYSHPRLNIPAEEDFRYIVNVVSSAIVNKPPPAAVANLLAHRNKIHHLNHDTSETLLKLFDKDPGYSPRTAASNNVTMPSRNFAIITENPPARGGGGGGGVSNGHNHNNNSSSENQHLHPHYHHHDHHHHSDPRPPHSASSSQHDPSPQHTKHKDGRLPLSQGETNCGTTHRAADPATHGRAADGSLDVCFCVEADQHDPRGRTEGYGLTVPALEYRGPRMPSLEALPPRSAGSRGS